MLKCVWVLDPFFVSGLKINKSSGQRVYFPPVRIILYPYILMNNKSTLFKSGTKSKSVLVADLQRQVESIQTAFINWL